MTTRPASTPSAAALRRAAAEAKTGEEHRSTAPVTPSAPDGTHTAGMEAIPPASIPASQAAPEPSPNSGAAAPTTRLLLPADAPRDAWLAARRQGVTASEIAAVLGISPWQSPFSLYWEKTGITGGTPDSDRLSLGRHLEPWIADRWADEHPEVHLIAPAGLWASRERPWQLATPDGLAYDSELGVSEDPVAVWEGKTSGTYDGWGEDGSDDIPPYYRAQVQWQMDVIGVRTAYVACLFLATQAIRTYEIGYDPADIALMRERGLAFHERVLAGDCPDIDAHTATGAALRALYPDADAGQTAVVPADIAREYRDACVTEKTAKTAKSLAENRLRDAMGDAKYATDDEGRKVATRSVYDRKPYTVGPTRIDRLAPATSKKEAAA